jgi:hypothetical protein
MEEERPRCSWVNEFDIIDLRIVGKAWLLPAGDLTR